MTQPSNLPDFALEWCRRLSADPKTLEPLQGGINNQVFRCYAGRDWFVIKGYSARSNSGHDRFKAEVEFLSYAQLVAPECVPRLLHADEANRSLVLEYLEGDRFRDGVPPSRDDIDQALTFMHRLNEDYRFSRERVKGSAAEGFLRLTEHLQNVEERLKEMEVEHLPLDIKEEASSILETAKQRLLTLEKSTAQQISQGDCADALDPSARCISPGDFGFHNALRTPKGVKFFDFEFSGWDDPTKAIADFDLQPRVPVWPRVRALNIAISRSNKALEARYKALFPILELKWGCIILSPFIPARWAQMNTLDYDQPLNQLLRAKLQIAQNYLLKD